MVLDEEEFYFLFTFYLSVYKLDLGLLVCYSNTSVVFWHTHRVADL